jgi:poly-gamma-glutamate synthesis protein (capsule biosynthesis protein)
MFVTAALVAVACGGGSDSGAGPDAPAGAAESGGSSGADQGGSSTTAARGPEGSGEPVTIAFAGDASFEGVTDQVSANPTEVLSGIAPALSEADLTIVNLEATLGSAGSPEGKTFTFRVPAEVTETLSSAGVDVATMANNHGLDYGQEGLQESLRIEASSGFPIIGVGQDADEAYAPFTTEINGQRIGIVAASDVIDDYLRSSWIATDSQPGLASAEEPQQARLAEEVRSVRPTVDTLIVYLHFGVEKETCPNARQEELVELMVDAGADIVVGSHTHRLQGVGFRGEQLVAYGLGNFVFRAGSPAGNSSGILVATATGRRIDGFQWRPAAISGGIPSLLTGSAEASAQASMDELRACAGLTDSPTTGSSGTGSNDTGSNDTGSSGTGSSGTGSSE